MASDWAEMTYPEGEFTTRGTVLALREAYDRGAMDALRQAQLAIRGDDPIPSGSISVNYADEIIESLRDEVRGSAG